ncbi:hypothetical protein M5K25_019125 [Dendrobium thyrsiflorum]|uniref:Prefoldin subunit 2 n=1 Tax=Dendrobium thyrsiflorum TaxID=117978 RepID=A0ABD0UKV7_DENTH
MGCPPLSAVHPLRRPHPISRGEAHYLCKDLNKDNKITLPPLQANAADSKSRRLFKLVGCCPFTRTPPSYPFVSRNGPGTTRKDPRPTEPVKRYTYMAHLLVKVSGREEGIEMASKASSENRESINEQAIASIYASMRSEINQFYSKITELEMEVSEHSLVIGAIQPLDPSRRCFRMIGGVLVERTINEVLPAVQRNKEGLQEVIARLNEALEKKKKEVAEFEVKHKIKVRKSDSETKDDGGRKGGSAQGVLVGPAS